MPLVHCTVSRYHDMLYTHTDGKDRMEEGYSIKTESHEDDSIVATTIVSRAQISVEQMSLTAKEDGQYIHGWVLESE